MIKATPSHRAPRRKSCGAGPTQVARCLPEQWYLARAKSARPIQSAEMLLSFESRSRRTTPLLLRLEALSSDGANDGLAGYLRSPPQAETVRWFWPPAGPNCLLTDLSLTAVADCDIRSHPLANVPRWSQLQGRLAVQRVLVPVGLEKLADLEGLPAIKVLRPKSKRQLARAVRSSAAIIDPGWIRQLDLDWQFLSQLAQASRILVDLASASALLGGSSGKPQVLRRRSRCRIPAACVQHSASATRGFALLDCFPLGTLASDGSFQLRVLRGGTAWKKRRGAAGLTGLLTARDPASGRQDIVCASAACGGGELLVTDVPWLIAGAHGQALAPRLLAHLLRMQLGLPVSDNVQYWHRSDDTQVLLRDLADIGRRYPPLQAVRWTGPGSSPARFSLVLPACGAASRQLVISTGRIDQVGLHDGLPPEPMVILMKMLSRELREGSGWARRYLGRLSVIWCFESAAGLRYAPDFPPARLDLSHGCVVRLRSRADRRPRSAADGLPPPAVCEVLPTRDGLLGDGSFEYQAALDVLIRRRIEELATSGNLHA